MIIMLNYIGDIIADLNSFWIGEKMISINRKLRLRDLEVFRFFKDNKMLTYVIIEDTRGPFTEEDKKLEPLCFLDDEDINEIINVFRIYLLSDESLKKRIRLC
jgi:hypothetical protein